MVLFILFASSFAEKIYWTYMHEKSLNQPHTTSRFTYRWCFKELDSLECWKASLIREKLPSSPSDTEKRVLKNQLFAEKKPIFSNTCENLQGWFKAKKVVCSSIIRLPSISETDFQKATNITDSTNIASEEEFKKRVKCSACSFDTSTSLIDNTEVEEDEDQNQDSNNAVSVDMSAVDEELQNKVDAIVDKLNISRNVSIEEVEQIIENSDLNDTEKVDALNVMNDTKESGLNITVAPALNVPDDDSADFPFLIVIVSVVGFLVVASVGSFFLYRHCKVEDKNLPNSPADQIPPPFSPGNQKDSSPASPILAANKTPKKRRSRRQAEEWLGDDALWRKEMELSAPDSPSRMLAVKIPAMRTMTAANSSKGSKLGDLNDEPLYTFYQRGKMKGKRGN